MLILSCLSFELPWFNPDSQVSSHLLPSLKIICSASSKIDSQVDIKKQGRSASSSTMRALYIWLISTFTWGKPTYMIQRDMNLTSAGESQLIFSGLLTDSFAEYFCLCSVIAYTTYKRRSLQFILKWQKYPHEVIINFISSHSRTLIFKEQGHWPRLVQSKIRDYMGEEPS